VVVREDPRGSEVVASSSRFLLYYVTIVSVTSIAIREELHSHERERALTNVFEIVEDVLARSEIEKTRLARLVRDVVDGAVVTVLTTYARRKCGPEVVQGVAVSPQSLSRLEFNTPDTNSIIDRKQLGTD